MLKTFRAINIINISALVVTIMLLSTTRCLSFIARTFPLSKMPEKSPRRIMSTSRLTASRLAASSNPKRYKIRTSGSSKAKTATVTSTNHEIMSDVPKYMGGDDAAPQPVELLLASLTGCSQATAIFVAKNMKPRAVFIEEINFELTAMRDQVGALHMPIDERPPVPSRLDYIRGKAKVKLRRRKPVSGSSDENSAEMIAAVKKIGEIVEVRCPIANMIKLSGCKLDIKWDLDHEDDDHEDDHEDDEENNDNQGNDKEGTKVNVYTPQLNLKYSRSKVDNTFASRTTFNVVGAGLAGISVAYHLQKICPSISINIYDRCRPGESGASAVAGGLLHPFTPRGGIVRHGEDGLRIANEMISAAASVSSSGKDVVLSDTIYRAAVTKDNVSQCMKIAKNYPELVSVDGFLDEVEFRKLTTKTSECLGGLAYGPGCKVVHVPTYLDELYKFIEKKGEGKINFIQKAIDFDEPLSGGVTIYAAGAEMFKGRTEHFSDLPVTRVEGQSIEFSPVGGSDIAAPKFAIICGKYAAPLPGGKVLVGATQEWKDEPLTRDEVVNELSPGAKPLCPDLFDGSKYDIARITSGTRAQSSRGAYGRLPIIGNLSENTFVFTALSGRGMIHHGVYGAMLARVILKCKSEVDFDSVDFNWWRKKTERSGGSSKH